jgi:hypothetical protein
MSPDEFRNEIRDVCSQLAGRSLDRALDQWLNAQFGSSSETYRRLKAACVAAVAAGWMCNREADGIRFGRVIKPADDVFRFSVDVVEMNDCAGPHHVHPNGEIDLIMPIEGDAKFDGRSAGWCVYPPGSAHHPTVSGGRALVLYLLPEGRIEFTGR